MVKSLGISQNFKWLFETVFEDEAEELNWTGTFMEWTAQLLKLLLKSQTATGTSFKLKQMGEYKNELLRMNMKEKKKYKGQSKGWSKEEK